MVEATETAIAGGTLATNAPAGLPMKDGALDGSCAGRRGHPGRV